MKTLVIIPTYNEALNIQQLLTQLRKETPEVDVLVVDDNSPDGTARLAQETREDWRSVHVLLRETERGLGTAYAAGFRFGLERDYQAFVTMDADLSHNPQYLPSMLETLRQYQVVVGSRYIRDGGIINWPMHRMLLSWTANRFARMVLGIKGNDLTSGYRAYRREILEKIPLEQIRSDGYSYLVEILYYAQRQGATIAEVPIIFFDRRMGQSKISKREVLRGGSTLLRLRLRCFCRCRG